MPALASTIGLLPGVVAAVVDDDRPAGSFDASSSRVVFLARKAASLAPCCNGGTRGRSRPDGSAHGPTTIPTSSPRFGWVSGAEESRAPDVDTSVPRGAGAGAYRWVVEGGSATTCPR